MPGWPLGGSAPYLTEIRRICNKEIKKMFMIER